MALGHSPISAHAISGSAVSRAGLSLHAVEGVQASLQLGTAVGSGVIRGAAVLGLEIVTNEPTLSSVASNGRMTVFLQTQPVAATLGILVGANSGGVAQATGLECATALGTDFIVNGTFVPAPSMVSVLGLGLTNQTEHQRWMRIAPSSTPGWVEIIVTAQLEEGN